MLRLSILGRLKPKYLNQNLVLALLTVVSTGVFLITGVTNADTLKIQPGTTGKDTWIWLDENFSHANDIALRVDRDFPIPGDNPERVLIEFDLSPIAPGTVIMSATLGLYKFTGLDDSLVVSTHRILDPWLEEVTWSSQPSITHVTESTTNVTTSGLYTWDLTVLTQNWIGGVYANYGVALFGDDGPFGQRWFYSSDYSADPTLRPYLEISFSPLPISAVPEPGTLLLLGIGLGYRLIRRRFKD
jgi:hypothetical protein